MHKNFGIKLSLDFRKSMQNGIVIGYRHLEINISPHYHFNDYKHNGNEFSSKNAIKTLIAILTYLGIDQQEYDDLNVCNIEFGINIVCETDIKNLINGLLFYKKTRFIIPDINKKPFFKISDTTKEKVIKTYAKGLQFAKIPEYGIDINTFRFEIKYKKSRPLKRILNKENVTANDLLDFETYKIFSQQLINEWEQILLITFDYNLNSLKADEVLFIQKANKVNFWIDMMQPKYRNKFGRYKEKYYSSLATKNNLQHFIKLQLIDKLFTLAGGASSPQEIAIKSGKTNFK